MKFLLLIAVLSGVYDVTYEIEYRPERPTVRVVAESASEAIESAPQFYKFRIIRVEEVAVPTESEIQAIIDKAKSLKSAIRNYNVKREKAAAASVQNSRWGKQEAGLAADAHHIEVLESALHASCVDAGIADLRAPEAYQERSWWLSGFHEQRWKPAQPNRLRDNSVTPD